LLLDFGDLLLRRGDFLALFLRMIMSSMPMETPARCLAETKLLEPVQGDHGFFVAADLVAFQIRSPSSALRHTLFGKPISSGQISLKMSARPWCR